MKICVLGAGVIGLTTAWRLAEAGHDVIIVDRHASTAKDASAANGGQLSYAFVAPLASPATLRSCHRCCCRRIRRCASAPASIRP